MIDEDEYYFTKDAAAVSLADSCDAVQTAEDGSTTIDWNKVPVEKVTDPPYAEAFETDKFYKLPATVARPIVQQYHYGDDSDSSLLNLKKPRTELKQAAWSLDRRPVTLSHPDTEMVRNVDDIHGFWSDVQYDAVADDLNANSYIPVNDEQAKMWIETHTDVSVGFHHRVTAPDEYNGVVGGTDDDDAVDGYQTDMYMNHCAFVGRGRCSSEQGCGVSDSSESSNQTHGSDGFDNAPAHGTLAPSTADAEYGVGDMVKWDSSAGTAYGRIDEIVEDGCTSRGKGDREVCADPDDSAVVIEVYDENGNGRDEYVRHKMSTLSSWDASDAEDIDLTPPEAAQENAQMALDAREETGNPNDCGTETGWRRANQLADGGELSPDVVKKMAQFNRHRDNSEQGEDGRADCGWMMWKAWGGDEGVDWATRKTEQLGESDSLPSEDRIDITEGSEVTDVEQTTDQPRGIYESDGEYYGIAPDENPDGDSPKYPMNSCSDVSDAWKLRGHGQYTIEQSTLESRIKRMADYHDCDMELESETDSFDALLTAQTYDVSPCDCTDCDCDDNTITTMTDFEIDFSDLSVDAALDRLGEEHEGLAELSTEVSELREVADTAEKAAEQIDADVDELPDKVDELSEKADAYDEQRQKELEQTAEKIADIVDKYDEASEVIDAYDGDYSIITEQYETLKSVTNQTDGDVETTVTTVDSQPNEENEQDAPTRKVPDAWSN